MVLRRLLTVGISALAMLLGSCVTDSATVYIAGVVQMDLDGCALDSGGTRLAYSAVDVNVGASGYDVRVAFVVQNLIQQRNFNVATDVSTVIIDQAEISLAAADGTTIQSAFIVDAASGVVPGSGDGISPGEGIVLISLIPASTLMAYAGIAVPTTIVAHVTLRGRTNGNLDVEGGPFTWPVQLLPAGEFGIVCGTAVGETRGCCAPGQDSEYYCLNVPGCASN